MTDKPTTWIVISHNWEVELEYFTDEAAARGLYERIKSGGGMYVTLATLIATTEPKGEQQ